MEFKPLSSIVLSCLVAMAIIATGGGCKDSPVTSTLLLTPEEANWPIVSYLGNFDRTEMDELAAEWIQDTLEEKQLTTPGQIEEFFQQMYKDLLAKNTVMVQHKGKEVEVQRLISVLVNLAEDSPLTYDFSLKYLVNLIEFVFGSLEAIQESSPAPDHDLGLYKFLKHYSREKFNIPRGVLDFGYKRNLPIFQGHLESGFDTLVASQVAEVDKSGKTPSMNMDEADADADEQLTQIARRIDLIGGHFDPNRMLKVAKAEFKQFKMNPNDHPNILEWFISKRCMSLSTRLGKTLEDLNILRLFHTKWLERQQIPAKMIKLNEYKRLCNQLSNPETRDQVLENMKEREGPSNVAGHKSLLQKAKGLVKRRQ